MSRPRQHPRGAPRPPGGTPAGTARSVLLRPLAAALVLGLAACGRLSGGGGGASAVAQPPDLPPIEDASAASAPSLLSALPTESSLHLTWDLRDQGDQLGLFVGTDPATLFDGAPTLAPLAGEGAVVDGLTTATTWFVGLARVDGPLPLPQGPVLRGRTGAPIHVDVAAPPGGNGLTPDSAYNDLVTALIDSLIFGGSNLWVAGGDYPGSALPLFPGTHLYGGFAPGFDPTARDPLTSPTVLVGVPGAPVVTAEPGPATAVLDGVVLDGAGSAPTGLQAFDAPVELRGVTVLSCTGPGLRLRGDVNSPVEAALLVDVLSLGHGAEGLALQGLIQLTAFRSRFESNVQEGLDLDDLQVPEDLDLETRFDGCRFAGNGTDGLDLDMAPAGANGAGRFRVVVERCLFERNGQTGLLLDVDFDQASGGFAELLLRGNVHRGNRGAGLILDLDGPSCATVDLARLAANGGPGLLLSSDVAPAQAVLTRSAAFANLGPGLATADGVAALLGAQVVLTGNGQALDPAGGPVALASSLAWAEPGDLDGARLAACLDLPDGAPVPLARLPVLTTAVDQWSQALPAELTLLEDPAGLSPAPTLVEVHDDGVPRSLAAFLEGGALLIDPAPLSAEPPCAVQLYADGDDVQEDWRAPPGSPASGAGLAPPAEAAPDAGALADPTAPFPGSLADDAPALLELLSVSPPLDQPLAPDQTLALTFRVAPDPARVGPHSVQVLDDQLDDVGAVAAVVDGVLELTPPLGGWPAGPLLAALHPALTALDGAAPAASVVLPLQVTP